MATVKVYQYVEVTPGSGSPIVLGKKSLSNLITLTGTGEVYHRVFNDIPATTVTELYADNLTGIKFFGVKSSRAATLGFGTANGGYEGANAITLTADVWQFFCGGETTTSAINLSARTADTTEEIGNIKIYIPSGSADVELIVAY